MAEPWLREPSGRPIRDEDLEQPELQRPIIGWARRRMYHQVREQDGRVERSEGDRIGWFVGNWINPLCALVGFAVTRPGKRLPLGLTRWP